MSRKSEIVRKTLETDIKVMLNMDGKGEANINTGIGFLDHMLTLFTKHGFMSLDVTAKGDLHIDAHHTVEDLGIAIGQAIKEALGEKKGIKRYGSSYVPMDEALAFVSLDISNRPFLVYNVSFEDKMTGQMEAQLFEEFFRAVAFSAGITLHIKLFYGTNTHHIIEAIFKAFGRALDEAKQLDPRIEGVMSTKGSL